MQHSTTADTSGQLVFDPEPARRLLAAGFPLTRLKPLTKAPVAHGWQNKTITAIDLAATGYGVVLGELLASLDPDHWQKAIVGLQACELDLEALMAAGARTVSTRPGSGGRSTFKNPGGLDHIAFNIKTPEGKTKTILELRTGNHQDAVPGVIYKDDEGHTYTQRYANGIEFTNAPDMPPALLDFWHRCSEDIDFKREMSRRFAAALGCEPALPISAGVALAYKPMSFFRADFNRKHDVATLLAKCGYPKSKGNRFKSPGSKNQAGIRPIPRKEDLWQCSHTSDPLCGTFDAWTIFVHLMHGGDQEAAERAYLESTIEAGPFEPADAPSTPSAGERSDARVAIHAPPDMSERDGETRERQDEASARPADTWPADPDESGGAPKKSRREQAIDDLGEHYNRAWTLEEMQCECVMLADGAYVAIINNPHFAQPFGVFRTLTANCTTTIKGADGKPKTVLTADLWQRSKHMEVHSRTFAPGKPTFCLDPQNRLCLNTWAPIINNPPADWQERVKPFLEHVAYLVPIESERERFLDWLAHCQQIPGTRPHTHYLMRTKGVQGIGRNLLVEMLGEVWAGLTVKNVDLFSLLSGGFNGEMSGKIFASSDELHADIGNNPRKISEALKSETTATTRKIRPKFGREHIEGCFTRWLMLSNHSNALPVSKYDRRIIVIDNPNVKKPDGYYTSMYKLKDQQSFISSVREFLQQRDISRFNAGESAPLSEAKQDLIDSSKSEYDIIAEDIAQNWPSDIITSGDLMLELTGADGKTPSSNIARAVANAVGMTHCGTRKVQLSAVEATRFWIVRNPEIWTKADNRKLVAEVKKGQEHKRQEASGRHSDI